MKRLDLDTLPKTSARRVALHVRAAAERSLRKGHPWLYAEGILSQSHAGTPGDLAVVYDRKDAFLAAGLYDSDSPIRVRVLCFRRPETIDASWLEGRLRAAVAKRAALESPETNGYRLVHGENDGMPGLVIDRYADTYVFKLYSGAWLPWLGAVLDALQRICRPARIVLRLGRSARVSAEVDDGMLLQGSDFDGTELFLENGLSFEVDVVRGQKTGFFLDQRENRARVEALSRGRDVLNAFAYTGAFSLYAARGGARSILSVDSSEPALRAALRNFELNGGHPSIRDAAHRIACGDAFDLLHARLQAGDCFDMVVIDPPAFAKSDAEVPAALDAYARLARLGVRLLRPSGHLVMASCTGRIDAQSFLTLVVKAAAGEGRRLRVIEQTGHAVDHPIGFPEGAYLKCVFAQRQ